jgi:hypothetical protein
MLASMAWTMWFFYGLDYVFAYAASMIHLWATIRGKSFPVTNSLSSSMCHCTWYLVPCNELSLMVSLLQLRVEVVQSMRYTYLI